MRKVFFDDKIEDEFYKSVHPCSRLPCLLPSFFPTSSLPSRANPFAPLSHSAPLLRNYLYGFGNTKQLAQTAAGRLQIGSK
jgi:hypothetical protein